MTDANRQPAAPLDETIDSAASFINSLWSTRPQFGIVLGTGAGQLATEIVVEQKIPYGDVPGFPSSTALGHKGQFVCGTLECRSTPVPVIAMEGRFHLYEGYPVDTNTLPIHVMQRLGVETLFVSNASGGMNPKMASGQIMLIASHLDLMYRSTPAMTGAVTCERPSVRSDCYDSGLIEMALKIAREQNFPLHQGVYAAMLGPNYETRAEYRFLRRVGADVVGMSTVPEVAVAARYGMRVLGMSIITNIAKPDVLETTSGQEVIDAAGAAAPHLSMLVRQIIAQCVAGA